MGQWEIFVTPRKYRYNKDRRQRSTVFYNGPSGKSRTPGILLPKQARYQLRHTWIFTFSAGYHAEAEKASFRVCGRCCAQARFCENFSTGKFPPQATDPRTSGSRFPGNAWVVYPPNTSVLRPRSSIIYWTVWSCIFTAMAGIVPSNTDSCLDASTSSKTLILCTFPSPLR